MAVAYVKLTFPDAGGRVTDWDSPHRVRLLADAAIQREKGPSVQAAMTAAQIYSLGQLAAGNYNFSFKNLGAELAVKSFAGARRAPQTNPIDNQRSSCAGGTRIS